MKRLQTPSDTERYALMEESVLLRIEQLKMGLLQLTDATTAERLLKEHGKDIRYIAPWKKWIVWNGANWETDSGGALIHTKGLEIVRSIYAEIYKTADYRERMEIERYAIKSESTRQRENFVRAARYILGLNAAVDDLDRDPWLLNAENGTIDLRTGELVPHRQEDMITKIANVKHDKDADCPKWKQFIREIMGYKGELVAFLQAAAGWAVSGDISEQSMFILYGTGANGKSTFLNVIMRILGDYAITTYAETFMKRSGDSLTNDIARLRGTRFVATAETEQGRRLSEHLIKQATGNDQMTARFLYGEHFNFVPTFKIFMASNHKPVIKGTDHGIWRRIKLIPFTTTIAEEKMDKHLEQKLLEEKSGILNWLIEGALRWQKEGLNTPSIVLNATDEYRGEMDAIGNFIKERCVQKPGETIKARELFRVYQEWCEENNELATSERMFGLRMKELGMAQKRAADGRYWQDIAVQD
jgi:putative DNA primase/helicase